MVWVEFSPKELFLLGLAVAERAAAGRVGAPLGGAGTSVWVFFFNRSTLELVKLLFCNQLLPNLGSPGASLGGLSYRGRAFN